MYQMVLLEQMNF